MSNAELQSMKAAASLPPPQVQPEAPLQMPGPVGANMNMNADASGGGHSSGTSHLNPLQFGDALKGLGSSAGEAAGAEGLADLAPLALLA